MFFDKFKTINPSQKVGLIFLLLGLLSLVGVLVFKIQLIRDSKNLSFSSPPNIIKENSTDDYPVKIIIPKINLNLPISPAVAKGDEWEISREGASYLLGSGVPKKVGNTVIYGHNWPRIFGNLRKVKIDDQIKLENGKGETYSYKVKEIKIVSPKDTEILRSTNESILTIYTCTGFLDSKRLVVIAILDVIHTGG